jgi:VWFA-related protein
VISVIATAAALSLLAQAQQPPTIRSRTTLVPVDIRVVDAKGNAVTDLKREDFTIQEDGRPQAIRLFETHQLTAGSAADATPLLRTRAVADAAPTPQTHRIFLFVFGRGRLQAPDKGIDAVARFVRERLLPQDRAAVLAFNRATDFTTDRVALLSTIDRFKKAHEHIEADLDQWFSSLRSLYGDKRIPDHIQREVDAVFRAPGGAPARQLPAGSATDARAIADDSRQNMAAALRGAIIATRDPGPFDTFDTSAAELVGMTFDEYATVSTQSTQDLDNIYTGIRYLRYLDGEKHLVFVTEHGMLLPRLENDYSVASLASDARVVIDVLMTGGLTLATPPRPSIPGAAPPPRAGIGMPTVPFASMFAFQAQRTIAELTGGRFNGYSSSERTLAAIDQSSRFEYLLGYVPENGTFDGRFRRITVKVNRPGVQMLSRHGYYARPDDVPFDRKQFMTYSRVTAAANTDAPMTDLTVAATVASQPGAAEAGLTVTLKAGGIGFEHTPGHHKASVQMVFMAGDDKQHLLGEHWQTADLDLTDENYQTFLAKGVSFTQAIPVAGALKYLKIVVYDYAVDRLGTALVTIPAK